MAADGQGNGYRAVADAFDAAAMGYDADRRILIPCFDPFYGAVLDAVRTLPQGARVLDLGAGTGLLSGMMAAARPDLDLTLVDISDSMLALAGERMARLGTPHRLVAADYADALPDGPWHAVASALSIHHLDGAAKRRLNATVRRALLPDAVFVNAEQVLAPTPLLEAEYDAWWVAAIRDAGGGDAMIGRARERMRHDRCAPVEPQLGWLRNAGFRHVHCRFQQMRFAVLEGRAPPPDPRWATA